VDVIRFPFPNIVYTTVNNIITLCTWEGRFGTRVQMNPPDGPVDTCLVVANVSGERGWRALEIMIYVWRHVHLARTGCNGGNVDVLDDRGRTEHFRGGFLDRAARS
jgi:hypothetical protein